MGKDGRDGNEPMSSLTHLVGALLSVAGLVLLVVFAALRADAWHVVAFSVFGAALILLYTASTLYHFFRRRRLKELFRRIDHALIYVLIAATYTAVCLTALRGPWGWSLFGVIWGLAIAGILVKSCNLRLADWLSTLLYLAMGWLIVVALYPLSRALPPAALLWLVAGGLFYTVGTLFYSLDGFLPRTRWFGMHEVFHLFVMAGSVCHWWLLYRFVLPA